MPSVGVSGSALGSYEVSLHDLLGISWLLKTVFMYSGQPANFINLDGDCNVEVFVATLIIRLPPSASSARYREMRAKRSPYLSGGREGGSH